MLNKIALYVRQNRQDGLTLGIPISRQNVLFQGKHSF